jgi:anti-anti-sigma factor
VSQLEFQVENNNSRVLFSLAGQITIDSSPGLRDRLLAVLGDPTLELVMVDLKNVPSIDLSGIATFIEALKIARASKTRFVLTGLQDRPRYLLEASGLLPFFEDATDKQQDATLKGRE